MPQEAIWGAQDRVHPERKIGLGAHACIKSLALSTLGLNGWGLIGQFKPKNRVLAIPLHVLLNEYKRKGPGRQGRWLITGLLEKLCQE